MRNKHNQRGQAIIAAPLVFILLYIVLAVWLGTSLVEYIVGTVTGSTIPGIIALIIALFTGFNFLIPVAIIVWLLATVGAFHHVAVSALPVIHHLIG